VKTLCLIPARMGSSRFPGKPMAPILGKPMIGHVYERVKKCASLDLVAVATCDSEIARYIESIGGVAVMTSVKHERASDRCAEALRILEDSNQEIYDVIVMVQGDEPMTVPEMIEEALAPMRKDSAVQVANLYSHIDTEAEFNDRNCIKVVLDLKGDAIYFSREPIPSVRSELKSPRLKQVCVIPFKRDFLFEYTQLEPTPLEIIESIDMLRVIENGKKVSMAKTSYKTHAVDTPEDLLMVESMMSPGAEQ
jgi:3-deoxy-manno-octulosonate cytidylyltransferase (CMP-KDO synthetase)